MSTKFSNPIELPRAEPESPWLGLRNYTEADHQLFAGREEEIDSLFWAVRMNRLVVLHGLSGSGKTSLLLAGLFPMLRRANYLPVYLRLDYSDETLSLADQVKAAIAADYPSEHPTPRSLWEFFHRVEIDFKDIVGRPFTPVLVFDQFEEAFLSGDRCPANVHSLLSELVCLAQNSVPPNLAAQVDQDPELATRLDFDGVPFHLVLAMRSDFLFALSRRPLAQCARTLVNVEVMQLSGVEALKVVHQVAPQLIDTATAETVVRMAAGGPNNSPLEAIVVDPPTLSVLCHQLNEARIAGGSSKIDLDLLHVRTREILEDFYESCFKSVPAAVREFVEERLVSPSGIRDTVLFESAVAELEQRGVEEPSMFIRELVDRYLLHMFESTGTRRIELANDILARIALKRRSDQKLETELKEERQRRFEAELLTRKERRRKRQAQLGAVALLFVVAVALSSLFWAVRASHQAAKAAEMAEEQKIEADRQRALAFRAEVEVKKLSAQVESLKSSSAKKDGP
jgi:conflict system STAND superfamily ATPase